MFEFKWLKVNFLNVNYSLTKSLNFVNLNSKPEFIKDKIADSL